MCKPCNCFIAMDRLRQWEIEEVAESFSKEDSTQNIANIIILIYSFKKDQNMSTYIDLFIWTTWGEWLHWKKRRNLFFLNRGAFVWSFTSWIHNDRFAIHPPTFQQQKSWQLSQMWNFEHPSPPRSPLGPLPAQSIAPDMATDGSRVHYVDLTPPNNMKHTASKWRNFAIFDSMES